MKRIKWFKLIISAVFFPISSVILWDAGWEKVVIFFMAFSITSLSIALKIEDYIKD